MAEVLALDIHGQRLLMNGRPGTIRATWRTGRPYEAELLEYIYSLAVSGLAVDVGANIGNHTLWFAGPCGLEVDAFEPRLHDELASNVDLNGFDDRVRVHAVALGARVGSANHVGKGRLEPAHLGPISVRPLDLMRLTDVALIKIDVEGMEPAVLRGAERTIHRDRPVIFAETWESNRAAIADILKPLGYRPATRFYARPGSQPVVEWVPS